MFAVKHMAYYEMIKYMIHLLSQMWVLQNIFHDDIL